MAELIMGPDPRPELSGVYPGIHIWGWMSSTELDWLYKTALTMNSIVEIGCLHGRSAYALLAGCEGRVFCIDPWDDEGRHSMPSFLSNCGHFANLTPMPMTSTHAARNWPTGDIASVDMTFIDGSHAYESVLIDIANWLPLTRWLICGHDYANANDGYPGVRKAVTEVFGDRVRVAPETSIWYVEVGSNREVADGLPTEFDYTDEYGKHYIETVTW